MHLGLRIGAASAALLMLSTPAFGEDAHADRVVTVADDGVGVLIAGDEVRLVGESGMSFGDTGFGKRMGFSVPLSLSTRTAILSDPDAAWAFGFKGFFEIGYSSADAFERGKPARLRDGWDTSLTPTALCTAAQKAAEGPGSPGTGFVGWLDQRLAIADLVALGDLDAALSAARTLERTVEAGAMVDHSGGALTAWVRAARHLAAGRTGAALDVASGNNAAGVRLDELVRLLTAGLVEDAADVAGTIPSVDCSTADASVLGALESSDLAAIAIAADPSRGHGRALRAALIDLVSAEVCEALGGARCWLKPERYKALGITEAEVAGGDIDVSKADPNADRAAVDDAVFAVGSRGGLWAERLRRHFATFSPGVGLCMDAVADRSVRGPRTDCDPTDPEGTHAGEQARWEEASAAWDAAQAAWGIQAPRLEQHERALARYATRQAMQQERKALEAAIARRASIETDLELIDEQLAAATKPAEKADLEARKVRFAGELAEDLLQPGASDRASRLEHLNRELSASSKDHAAALSALPGLQEARERYAAAQLRHRRAQARWAGHEAAWSEYRRAARVAPYESARAWRSHVARHVIAPWDGRPQWSAGLQVAGGYDRLDIYLGALHAASAPRAIDAFFVELGAQGTLTLGHMALQARVGVALDQAPRASQATHCVPASSDGAGGPAGPADQVCESVPFIESRPEAIDSGYLRLGALLLSPTAAPKGKLRGFAGFRGGLDLRLGFEDLGRESLLEARVALVAFPTVGPLLGRYGLGFRSQHHLTPCDPAAGKTTRCGGALESFTPFVFLGGSFAH